MIFHSGRRGLEQRLELMLNVGCWVLDVRCWREYLGNLIADYLLLLGGMRM